MNDNIKFIYIKKGLNLNPTNKEYKFNSLLIYKILYYY